MQTDFEAAMLENPDDDAAYLVYADWLIGQGDPRGELIVTQHDADEAEGARRTALRRSAKALLDKHAAYFLGPLATPSATHDSKLVWRYGYVRKLELQWHRTASKRSTDRGAFDLIESVLLHPSFQFVIELQLGCIYDKYGDMELQAVIDMLASMRRPTAVRTLDLGITGGYVVDTAFGELSEIVAALPRLRRIRLRERGRNDPSPDDPVHEMMIKRARR